MANQYPTEALDIIKTFKDDKKLQAKYGSLGTYISVCEWNNDPKLREEFGNFEAYDAFSRAQSSGKVKILGAH